MQDAAVCSCCCRRCARVQKVMQMQRLLVLSGLGEAALAAYRSLSLIPVNTNKAEETVGWDWAERIELEARNTRCG